MSKRIGDHIRTNVVGYVALIVAVMGVPMAWAVARNTIGSPQLKRNAVKNADVADDAIGSAEVIDNSLTGNDVNEATLGQVQSAQTAQSATSADSANLLDGQDSSAFLGANAKAADANLLDGQDSSAFLGANAIAANSNLLDGIDSGGFLSSAPDAVSNSNVQDETLSDAEIGGMETRAFSLSDPLAAGVTTVPVAADAAFIVTASCEQNPAGTFETKVEITSDITAFAVDSTAPGGADNQTAVPANTLRTLASVGPSATPTYGAGAWSAAPVTGSHGIVGVGTEVTGSGQCYVNFTSFGER